MLLLIVPLKAEASCADDKQKKELTGRLRCLYGLRSGGSRIALYLAWWRVGERVIELAGSAIDWNFNIDTESAASTDVWK